MCQMQPVLSRLICRRPSDSSGVLRLRSGCQRGGRRALYSSVWRSAYAVSHHRRMVGDATLSNLYSTNLAPCRRRDSQSHLKGVDLRTPQLKIPPPRRRMSGATQFATILTASPSTRTWRHCSTLHVSNGLAVCPRERRSIRYCTGRPRSRCAAFAPAGSSIRRWSKRRLRPLENFAVSRCAPCRRPQCAVEVGCWHSAWLCWQSRLL
jgi:hypothetical protein